MRLTEIINVSRLSWKSLCPKDWLPRTMAMSQSPVSSALTAIVIATIDDEQAVSTVSDGPWVPKKYATWYHDRKAHQ
jgi:hypothetical protein